MSEKPSKFAAILKTRQSENEEKTPTAETAPPNPKKRRLRNPTSLTPKKPGRPPGQGKRANPDFAQVTAYIPEKLHTDTKINLLRLPEKRDFSQLIAELLENWNKKPQ